MPDLAATLAWVPQLNQPGQPFQYVVAGPNVIVGTWRWQDQTLFAPQTVTAEVQQFQFIVELQPDGTYKEHTTEASQSSQVGASGGGIHFGASTSKFSGNSAGKSFSISLGHDNQTGQTGVVTASFDSNLIKQPLRAFLESQGWKKAGGLFSKLRR